MLSKFVANSCFIALPLISPFVRLNSSISFFTVATASFLCALTAFFSSSASAFLFCVYLC